MYLIDGYNLLYQSDFVHRDDLIDQLARFCRREHKSAHIVFDGYSPTDLSSSVLRVTFAGDADAEIIKIIRETANPNEWKLVSDDKELIFAAQKRGVEVWSVERFLYLLAGEAATYPLEKDVNAGLSDDEAEEALLEFNNFQT
jgi:hypothetical protein